MSAERYYPNVNTQNRNKASAIIMNDGVSATSAYLNDGRRNYGMRWTLTNNTGDTKNVSWSFTDYSNVRSSGGFAGTQYLIGYGQAEIVTFTQIDTTQDWHVGAPSLN